MGEGEGGVFEDVGGLAGTGVIASVAWQSPSCGLLNGGVVSLLAPPRMAVVDNVGNKLSRC